MSELRRLIRIPTLELSLLEATESTDELETGSTFAENALLKARYYHQSRGIVTIADDSGLEVFALGGAPGVYSARYAGPEADDSARIEKLLENLKGVPRERRQARFRCAAAIVWDGGESVFDGDVNGSILENPRGDNGFGFDPIFFYEPLARTFAELTQSEKETISHRGIAFRKLSDWLSKSPLLDSQGSDDKI